MLTIAEVREALGDVAAGKSDEELTRLRDEFQAFARALVGVSMGRAQQQDVRLPAMKGRAS